MQRTLRDIGIVLDWTKDTSTKKSTRIINIRNLASEASDRQVGDDSASNQIQNSDATSDSITRIENKVPSDEENQICAQNQHSDDMTPSDSNLPVLD